MSYKRFVSMNIAIIGAGKVGEALAQGLALAGHEIFIGLRNENEYVSDYLLKEFDNINISSVDYAATIADIIIIAAAAGDVREMAYLMDDVRRKVIIDASNVAPEKPEEYSSTVSAIRAITGAQHVVKCFNCTGYENLLNPFFKEDAIDMFVAGDSKKGKEIAKLLAKDLGFANCYDFGGNDTIPLLEDMARCWMNLAIRQKMGRKIAFKLVRRK